MEEEEERALSLSQGGPSIPILENEPPDSTSSLLLLLLLLLSTVDSTDIIDILI